MRNIPVPILRASIPFRPDYLVAFSPNQPMPLFRGTRWGDQIDPEVVYMRHRFHLSEEGLNQAYAAGMDPERGFTKISIVFDAMRREPATIDLEQTTEWLVEARLKEIRKSALEKLAEQAE